MTYQRTRGPLVTFYPRTTSTTERGVVKYEEDRTQPQHVRAAMTVERTAKAEAMGQVEIEMYQCRLPWDLEGVGPGAIIVWRGDEWDLVGPAHLHDSIHPRTRHQTVMIRKRPGGARP